MRVSLSQSGDKSVQTNSSLLREKPAIGWFPKVVAVLGALLLITGALIALFHPVMLGSPHDEINGAVHIYAGYLAARNLAMAIMLLAALGFAAKRLLTICCCSSHSFSSSTPLSTSAKAAYPLPSES